MSNETLQAEIDTALDDIEANEAAEGSQSDGVADDTTNGKEEPKADESVADDPQVDEGDGSAEDGDPGATDEDASEAEEGEDTDDDTISDATIERAVQAGFSLADARSFGDEAALDKISREMLKDKRELEDFRRLNVVEDEDIEEPADPFADMPKLDPEQHEPQVIEAFSRLQEIVKSQGEEIRASRLAQEDSLSASASASVREVGRWFDEQIAGLGEDFSDTLGKGDLESLSQGSSQHAKRSEIANYTATLMAGYDAQGLQSPPREEIFRDAARHVLRDEYDKVRSKKLSGKVARRSKQHIQRVGGQKASATPSAEEETAAVLDAKFGTGP